VRYAALARSIALIAASRSATPSFATPAETWRLTVTGDSDSVSLTSAVFRPELE
jgi:hypothetical protein